MNMRLFDLFRDEGVWSLRIGENVEHLDPLLSDLLDERSTMRGLMRGLCLIVSSRCVAYWPYRDNRLIVFDGSIIGESAEGAMYVDSARHQNLRLRVSKSVLGSVGATSRVLISVYDVSLRTSYAEMSFIFQEEAEDERESFSVSSPAG